MRKVIITLVLIIVGQSVFPQTKKQSHELVADAFVINYNDGNYEAIFNSFSTETKTALPLSRTQAFLQKVNTQLGKMQKRSLMGYKNNQAIYKVTCEKGAITLTIAINKKSEIAGYLIRPYTDQDQSKIVRNSTKMILPFTGFWTVGWGGDTKELNYHVTTGKASKHAFDFLITDASGRSYRAGGKRNEDYYAFGQELLAPCNGEIVLVVDGVKDNKPGIQNRFFTSGNTVILKASNSEYLFFSHFKQHSIKVKQGEIVKQGQVLGLCGNSGNSSEPHLHFHIQNLEDRNNANGVKCYFDKINVNGKAKSDYSPIKGEVIKSE